LEENKAPLQHQYFKSQALAFILKLFFRKSLLSSGRAGLFILPEKSYCYECSKIDKIKKGYSEAIS